MYGALNYRSDHMLPRAELLKFVVALGREFQHRGMHEHAKKLRLYYLAVKRGLTVGVHEADLHWKPFGCRRLKMTSRSIPKVGAASARLPLPPPLPPALS